MKPLQNADHKDSETAPTKKTAFGGSDETGFAPLYRAVTTNQSRQGLRLEQAYWDCLNTISNQTGNSVGELIDACRNPSADNSNLSSRLRVSCLRWMNQELDASKQMLSDQTIRNTLYACPSPALALTADKRLHSFNQPFHRLVTERFATSESENVLPQMKLLLDLQIQELIEQLRHNANKPVTTGIAIGVGHQTLRSNLNAVLAASPQQNIILGYVLP